MKNVVITGSTRGIGFGLAEAFLARDCKVAISGRSKEGIEKALETLQKKYGTERVMGAPCDVRDISQVEKLWQASQGVFGQIDFWINNAGYSGSQNMVSELSPEQAEEIVETNIMGVIYGSQVAAKGMSTQGGGQIFNMEGAGSDGRKHKGLVLYCMTKYAVSYFTRGLIDEMKDGSVKIGSLKPGMVITDFILNQYENRPDEWERAKRIFNIIADRVETVAPWMVNKMLENSKHGVQISWTSRLRIISRFLTAPITKRDLFG